MGLFFNYDKPGPGIDKNAPKKKGIALYMELIWRKLKLLVLSSMLYFVLSLPVTILYFLMLSGFISPQTGEGITSGYVYIILCLALLLTVLWGCGPVSCGYTYLMRSFAREEHVWLLSDFFERIRKNFKYGITILIIDIVFLYMSLVAFRFYSAMYAEGQLIGLILMSLMIMFFAIYTLMHYYMYQVSITFDINILGMLRNSFIFAMAYLPMNVLLTVICIALMLVLTLFFTPIAVLILMFVCWMSFMRFPIDFYSARKIKRDIIDKMEEEKKDAQ